MMQVTLLNSPCDRCRKVCAELHPWKLSDAITYRRKHLEFPWLCGPCFVAHKELASRRGYT